MKKLLVLTLVFYFVTMANASGYLPNIPGLDVAYDSGTNTTTIIATSPVITLSLGKIEPYSGILYPGTLGAFSMGNEGLNYPDSLGMTESYGTIVYVSGTTGSSTGITGLLYNFTASGAYDAIIGTNSLYETSFVIFEDGRTVDLTDYHFLPEPMTICLLGLGGLAVFRKRRA